MYFAKDVSKADGWIWLWFVAIGAVAIGQNYWRFFVQWLSGLRGQDWPTIQATIDNVSVAEQVQSGRGGSTYTYLATLTYFYRNPELQAGEYCREFGLEDEAQAWANSYKGETVTVHVNPRDPSRSVLRKQDL